MSPGLPSSAAGTPLAAAAHRRPGGAGLLAASLLPSIVGLATSAMLAIDYRRAVPVFCSEASGCEAVKHSPFAAFFGVPTPLFGVVGFAAIGVAALLPGRAARLGQAALSWAAALVALLLVLAQATMGRFCPYCCVADASGVGCGVAAAWRLARFADARIRPLYAAAGALGLAAAGVVPFVAGSRVPAVPAVIRSEQAGAGRRVTVVDFVDFECPFCRMAQAVLEPVLEAYGGRVRLLRRQVPLRMHAHARDAARAACCGERLGRGDAMAEALFSAPVEELTPAGCEKLAERIGIAIEPFRACTADPRTDARIDADRAEFRAAGGEALPTIWIGGQEIVGVPTPESLKRALAEALSRAGG